MRVLFDHNVPRRFKRLLNGIDVKTTREMRWQLLSNGELLRETAQAGFDAFLSIDKNIRHQQNLRSLPLPVIVIDCLSNALPSLLPFAQAIVDLPGTQLSR